MGRRRRRELMLLDLPLQILETIALRVAASQLHVVPLLPSAPAGDVCHAFLGDYPVAASPDELSAERSLWLFGSPSNNSHKVVPSRLRQVALTSRSPSSVLNLHAVKRLQSLRATCRRLGRAASQAVTGVDVGYLVDSVATVLALGRMPGVRTVLASDPWECEHNDCPPVVKRDDTGVPLCDDGAAHEDTVLLHEALGRCRLDAFAYRGAYLPRALVPSLAAEGVLPLRRLSLQCYDAHHLGLDDILRVHARTLEELSLLLCLDETFFSRLLACGSRGDGTMLVQFPALRALCLPRRHPLDVAKLVAASPSLSAVRFMCDIPAVNGPSACGWAVPLCSIGVPDVVPALKTALAPAVGKGLLTSVALDTHCEDGITSLFEELAGLGGLQETLRSVSMTCNYDGDWALCPDISLHFPSLRSLSLRFCLDCDLPVFLEQLGQSLRASSRFPLLSDLHVDAKGGSLAPAGRTLRQHVASAASHMLVIDLPALKRLHVGLRVEGVAVVLRSLSSATLEVLSLSTSPLYMPPVLPTSALACLPSRCHALRAMRLQDMRLDRSFPGTLALWGLHRNYVKCHLVSPFHSTDEAAVTSTQFL